MDKKGTILGLMMATCIGLTGCLGNAEDEITDTEHNLDISDIADFSLNKFETVPTMKPQVIEIKKSEDISEDIKKDIEERGINIPEPNITILGQEEIDLEIGTTKRVAGEIVDDLEIGTTEAGCKRNSR
ncbi:hypothetical protein [Candidatus Epulonipiscium viviparus]|uniref:hypothetical protein n=1 Tax=Candidatus Epulonipiscium viviparus TaxID=420336 RepID=UPI00273809E2|nr:hypothetical protein [Candidatus Epulopiscium viviparus]